MSNPTSSPARWTPEQAHAWFKAQPWALGANFVPASAINQLAMWQAETFDPERIDLELGWAAGLEHEHHARLPARPAVVAGRRRLQAAHRPIPGHRRAPRHLHDVRAVRFLLGPASQAGAPARAHPRRAQLRLGAEPLGRPAGRPRQLAGSCAPMSRTSSGTFGQDPRVTYWDIWNEPDNQGGGMGYYLPREAKNKIALVAEMIPQAFDWARAQQPHPAADQRPLAGRQLGAGFARAERGAEGPARMLRRGQLSRLQLAREVRDRASGNCRAMAGR